jgi:urease accessory protein
MTIATMSEAVLLRLFAWLSPAFPTGGFASSAGLERAVSDCTVSDAAGLRDWLATLLIHGSPWNDAMLFGEAWRNCSDGEKIAALSELAEALAGSAERHGETMDQGRAFLTAARHWFEPAALPEKAPLPVAVGMACGLSRIELETGLMAYLQAFVSSQLQAAIRLSVIGQDGAARLLAALEPVIAETASRAANASVDDLGGCAFMAEIAAMNHETMQSRLFLS